VSQRQLWRVQLVPQPNPLTLAFLSVPTVLIRTKGEKKSGVYRCRWELLNSISGTYCVRCDWTSKVKGNMFVTSASFSFSSKPACCKKKRPWKGRSLLLNVRNDAKFRRNCYTTTPSVFETFHSLNFIVMAGNCCVARSHHLPTSNTGRMRILRIIRFGRMSANL